MADNVAITAGSGTTIATDDISSVQYQRVKVTLGADGAATADLQGVVESGSSALPALAVGGGTPHDSVDSGNPLKVGGYAKAAAPTDASADGDRVNAWFVRNGAQATVLTAAGALVGGDATNGLDVDVTRLPALVAGSANIGTVNALPIGGGTIANGQVTPTASAATLLASRATRVDMTFYNGTNMTVYIGIASVTTANGFALLPGAGITLRSTALIQNIVSTVTGLTGVVSYIESY